MRSAWDRSVPKNVWQPAAQAVSQHERVALSLPAREAGHASRARQQGTRASCSVLSAISSLRSVWRIPPQHAFPRGCAHAGAATEAGAKQARRCLHVSSPPRLRCPSSSALAPTSWKCLWAVAPPACASSLTAPASRCVCARPCKGWRAPVLSAQPACAVSLDSGCVRACARLAVLSLRLIPVLTHGPSGVCVRAREICRRRA